MVINARTNRGSFLGRVRAGPSTVRKTLVRVCFRGFWKLIFTLVSSPADAVDGAWKQIQIQIEIFIVEHTLQDLQYIN